MKFFILMTLLTVFLRGFEAIKPGACPVSTPEISQSEFCDSATACVQDEDCEDDKKCCWYCSKDKGFHCVDPEMEKSGTCPSENYTFERLENECPKLKSCELDKECAGDKRCCPYCAYGTKRCVDTLETENDDENYDGDEDEDDDENDDEDELLLEFF